MTSINLRLVVLSIFPCFAVFFAGCSCFVSDEPLRREGAVSDPGGDPGEFRCNVVEVRSGRLFDDASLNRIYPNLRARRVIILTLNGSNVSDNGMDAVRKLDTLEILDIGQTRVTTAGVAKLRGMAHLQYLRINGLLIDGATALNLRAVLPGVQITDEKAQGYRPDTVPAIPDAELAELIRDTHGDNAGRREAAITRLLPHLNRSMSMEDVERWLGKPTEKKTWPTDARSWYRSTLGTMSVEYEPCAAKWMFAEFAGPHLPFTMPSNSP